MGTEAPRIWRLEKIRYGLVGEKCPHCEKLMFPPRDICIECGEPVKATEQEIYTAIRASVSFPTGASTSSK